MNETVKVGNVEHRVEVTQEVANSASGMVYRATLNGHAIEGFYNKGPAEEAVSRIIAALRAATPSPAPAEKAVKITPGVWATDSEKWHTGMVSMQRHKDGWWGVLYSDSHVIYGRVDADGRIGDHATLTRRISDLPDARGEKPSPPSPSPTALAAAEEIANMAGFGKYDDDARHQLATILDRHFAPELAVVEAAKALVEAMKKPTPHGDEYRSMAAAVLALSAREGGAA